MSISVQKPVAVKLEQQQQQRNTRQKQPHAQQQQVVQQQLQQEQQQSPARKRLPELFGQQPQVNITTATSSDGVSVLCSPENSLKRARFAIPQVNSEDLLKVNKPVQLGIGDLGDGGNSGKNSGSEKLVAADIAALSAAVANSISAVSAVSAAPSKKSVRFCEHVRVRVMGRAVSLSAVPGEGRFPLGLSDELIAEQLEPLDSLGREDRAPVLPGDGVGPRLLNEEERREILTQCGVIDDRISGVEEVRRARNQPVGCFCAPVLRHAPSPPMQNHQAGSGASSFSDKKITKPVRKAWVCCGDSSCPCVENDIGCDSSACSCVDHSNAQNADAGAGLSNTPGRRRKPRSRCYNRPDTLPVLSSAQQKQHLAKYIGDGNWSTQRFARFADPAQRLASFVQYGGYPHSKPSPEALAAAGFFYFPAHDARDQCRCFCCGLTLDAFEPEDIPILEHRLRRPDCEAASGDSHVSAAKDTAMRLAASEQVARPHKGRMDMSD